MPLPYYHLLGHAVAAEHAFHESAGLVSALKKAGFDKNDVAQTKTLVEEGEALVEKKLEEVGEDRIVEHNTHGATSELEMWIQTTSFLVKKNVDDETLLNRTLGEEIHADEHTAAAIARAHRILAMIRTHEDLSNALGSRTQVRDMLTRGWSLLKRLYKTTEIRLEDGKKGAPDHPAFDALASHREAMIDWLAALNEAAKQVAEKDPRLLGRLGFVPDDVGIPVGGTSYAVVLHERGQTDPPDPADARPATGQWSVGRQGRNRENLGKGWLASRFEQR